MSKNDLGSVKTYIQEALKVLDKKPASRKRNIVKSKLQEALLWCKYGDQFEDGIVSTSNKKGE